MITVLNKRIPGLKLKESDVDRKTNRRKTKTGDLKVYINEMYRLKKDIPKPIFLTEDLTKLTHHFFKR